MRATTQRCRPHAPSCRRRSRQCGTARRTADRCSNLGRSRHHVVGDVRTDGTAATDDDRTPDGVGPAPVEAPASRPSTPSTVTNDDSDAEPGRFIFEEWHRRTAAADLAGLLELYAEDATFESPLVPRLLDR